MAQQECACHSCFPNPTKSTRELEHWVYPGRFALQTWVAGTAGQSLLHGASLKTNTDKEWEVPEKMRKCFWKCYFPAQLRPDSELGVTDWRKEPGHLGTLCICQGNHSCSFLQPAGSGQAANRGLRVTSDTPVAALNREKSKVCQTEVTDASLQGELKREHRMPSLDRQELFDK